MFLNILTREQCRCDEEVPSFELEKKSGTEHRGQKSSQPENDRRNILITFQFQNMFCFRMVQYIVCFKVTGSEYHLFLNTIKNVMFMKLR
jgi:hypothetical protein